MNFNIVNKDLTLEEYQEILKADGVVRTIGHSIIVINPIKPRIKLANNRIIHLHAPDASGNLKVETSPFPPMVIYSPHDELTKLENKIVTIKSGMFIAFRNGAIPLLEKVVTTNNLLDGLTKELVEANDSKQAQVDPKAHYKEYLIQVYMLHDAVLEVKKP